MHPRARPNSTFAGQLLATMDIRSQHPAGRVSNRYGQALGQPRSSSMAERIAYQIIHKPTGQVWSSPDLRTVWPELNQAVMAYNQHRAPNSPFYSAQNEYIVRATRMGLVK